MNSRALIPWVGVAALVLAVVVLWFGFAAPAGQDLARETARARIVVDQAEAELPHLVGTLYASDVEAGVYGIKKELDQLRLDLTLQDSSLRQWFPDFVGIAAGDVPPGKAYAERYAFHRDELGRNLWAALLSSAGKPVEAFTAGDFGLLSPEFLEKRRDPSRTEVIEAQYRFNLQQRLLLAAAHGGAFSTKALEITPGWGRRERAEDYFLEDKVELHLLCDARLVPDVLRRVIAVSDKGPTVRLLGVETKVRPIPSNLREGSTPPVSLRVSLAASLYRGLKSGGR